MSSFAQVLDLLSCVCAASRVSPLSSLSYKSKMGLLGAWSCPPPPQHSGRHVECKRDVVMSQRPPASPIRFVPKICEADLREFRPEWCELLETLAARGFERSALRLAPAMLKRAFGSVGHDGVLNGSVALNG